MTEELDAWKRRFDRERTARKNAEKLLEDKSLEIWTINQGLEQKILQRTQELESALQEAEAANRAKDAFLSSMSHELRTPLNAIIGFSQILVARPETDGVTRSFIEKIQIAGKTLLSLVNTVLDFSKIESGKMEFSPENIHVETLLKEIKTIAEPLLMKKKLIFAESHGGIETFYGDFHLIKQAMINLISNAIKFSPNGSTITVEIGRKDTDSVRICVSDQGEGIAAEKMDLLFKPFSQLSNAKTVDEAGTGLGLMIIKKIADAHGGEVGVENSNPKGARFWLNIPQ